MSPVSYRQNPRTAGRIIDGLAFIVTPDDNKLHTLNATGTAIWELTESPRSLDEIVAALAARFDVDGERARADAIGFCADLCARRILEATS